MDRFEAIFESFNRSQVERFMRTAGISLLGGYLPRDEKAARAEMTQHVLNAPADCRCMPCNHCRDLKL